MNEDSLGRLGSHKTQFDYATVSGRGTEENGEKANDIPGYIIIYHAQKSRKMHG